MSKEIYKTLAEDNSYNFNIVKTIEELNELSTALSQHLTKGTDLSEIIEEVGDVKIRFKILNKMLGLDFKSKVKKRVTQKTKELFDKNKIIKIGKDLHYGKRKYTV